MSQLVLPIRLQDHAIFDTFHAAGNEQLIDHLTRIADNAADGGCWISGAFASGKTHLLQAVCERAADDGVYLSAGLLSQAGPAMLDGLENRRIVAIDDITLLCGEADWETALFTLYNRLLERGGSLIVSAPVAQREADILLDDLRSRLSQLPTFTLRSLDESQRMEALKIRASHRGLELPSETARYLLNRSRRDMNSLYALLDHLDLEALRAKRRLTVPFVREVLARE